MDKKKMIITIGVVVFVLVIALFLISRFLVSQKSSIVVPSQEEKAVSLPLAEMKSQIVDNPKNLNDINSAFSQSISQPVLEETKKHDFQLIEFKGKDNQVISLDDFTKATGLKINPDIKNLLKSDDYFLFYCFLPTNQKSFGIVFRLKLFESYRNLYSDEARWMKEWEKTILRDTYKIIFPDINFSEVELSQEVKFKDGKYRFAEIVLPNGSRSSINYSIIGDYTVITSSKECLDKINDYLEPIEP